MPKQTNIRASNLEFYWNYTLNGRIPLILAEHYWTNIYSCFNNEVCHAFYSYLYENINIVGFHPQNFPTTKSKIDSYAKRLELHESFLKHNYILNKLEIKCTVQELYDEFLIYCKSEQRTPNKKIDFGTKLRELGIDYYKSCGNNKYKISYEQLQEIATTRHWIHDIDDYFEEEKPKKECQFVELDDSRVAEYTPSEGYNELKNNNSKLEKELIELKKQFESLKLENEKLKQQKPSFRIVDSDSDSDSEEEEEEVKPKLRKLRSNKIVDTLDSFDE